jgi:hypothetical protein
MSMLDAYARDSGFEPASATRRLIGKVHAEASEPANRGELGAWMFTFARLATMTEPELKERGCPVEEIEPLSRFALAQATSLAFAQFVRGGAEPETIGKFIARIARLQWGTEAATAAFLEPSSPGGRLT